MLASFFQLGHLLEYTLHYGGHFFPSIEIVMHLPVEMLGDAIYVGKQNRSINSIFTQARHYVVARSAGYSEFGGLIEINWFSGLGVNREEAGLRCKPSCHMSGHVKLHAVKFEGIRLGDSVNRND